MIPSAECGVKSRVSARQHRDVAVSSQDNGGLRAERGTLPLVGFPVSRPADAGRATSPLPVVRVQFTPPPPQLEANFIRRVFVLNCLFSSLCCRSK